MSEQGLSLEPVPSVAEARSATRVRSFLRGEITHSNGAARFDCVVRDISETGARIQITSAITIPEHFELLIPQRNVREKARLMWRHGEEIGITFMREAKPGAKEPAPASGDGADVNRRVMSLEAEIAQLRSQLATMRAMVEQVYRDRA